jgi:hypothetical protein
VKILALATVVCGLCSAQDINFTNRLCSFTNLEGRSFDGVALVRGDLDGIIWRKDASGGRICYTNIHPDILESWGVSSNRIEVSRIRARNKALADAKYRAARDSAAAEELALEAANRIALAKAKPILERDKQKAADQEAITVLEQQIRITRNFKRRNQAFADDYNTVNSGTGAPFLTTSARDEVTIKEYEEKLQQMKADFARKYKEPFKGGTVQ